ncbi:MAG: extensin family protein [Nannocystaceae bacterium]|nr:extensin family protein [Nannocystaceae bacterium]
MASRLFGFLGAAVLVLASSPATAGRSKPRRVPNMPRGWSWPANPAMAEAGKRCLDGLRERNVAFQGGHAKKVNTPILLPTMELAGIRLEPTWRKGPFVLDCHLALALHAMAPELKTLGVSALRFSTIHDHRYVKRNGRKTNILSRHAIGLAMDIFEVRLDDGRVLKVKRSYASETVLHDVERVFARSDRFRTPLTPSNDPKGHDDHFHLEARMPLRSVLAQ